MAINVPAIKEWLTMRESKSVLQLVDLLKALIVDSYVYLPNEVAMPEALALVVRKQHRSEFSVNSKLGRFSHDSPSNITHRS
jgi:hypothetical protein